MVVLGGLRITRLVKLTFILFRFGYMRAMLSEPSIGAASWVNPRVQRRNDPCTLCPALKVLAREETDTFFLDLADVEVRFCVDRLQGNELLVVESQILPEVPAEGLGVWLDVIFSHFLSHSAESHREVDHRLCGSPPQV